MTEQTLAFLLWSAVAGLIVLLGISALFAKKPVGFWSNARPFEVTDVKKYNAAVGKLFIVFGIALVLLGLPLLAEETTAFIIISILGVMALAITAMVIYVTVIEKKYRK